LRRKQFRGTFPKSGLGRLTASSIKAKKAIQKPGKDYQGHQIFKIPGALSIPAHAPAPEPYYNRDLLFKLISGDINTNFAN